MSWFIKILRSAIPAPIAGSNHGVENKSGTLAFVKLFSAISFRTLSVLLKCGSAPRKLFFYVAICIMCSSCFLEKDLQGDLMYATLVKVEEVNRYPNVKTKMLTWETTKYISFITYESSAVDIPIGTRTRVLVFK